MGRLRGGIVVGMLGCLLWIFLPGIAVGQWYSSGTLHHGLCRKLPKTGKLRLTSD